LIEATVTTVKYELKCNICSILHFSQAKGLYVNGKAVHTLAMLLAEWHSKHLLPGYIEICERLGV
jgi:hypothetical protein